uniref:Uncharacterized protein n=1 Tax=Tetranychus urticae TaxID=32264 RepID=T1JWG0_TETUR
MAIRKLKVRKSLETFEILEVSPAALGDKIRSLDEIVQRLVKTHSETAEQTYQKQFEINQEWDQLIAKATARNLTIPMNFNDSWLTILTSCHG